MWLGLACLELGCRYLRRSFVFLPNNSAQLLGIEEVAIPSFLD